MTISCNVETTEQGFIFAILFRCQFICIDNLQPIVGRVSRNKPFFPLKTGQVKIVAIFVCLLYYDDITEQYRGIRMAINKGITTILTTLRVFGWAASLELS